MRTVPALAVVIPAFNEEQRIGATLSGLRDYLERQPWSWTIHVVDDGSTDGTARLVREFGRAESRVCLLSIRHAGKGAAVRAGILAASADYRFICDADLSMPVHELGRFLPPALCGVDVAIGTREGAGARRVGEPLVRHLAGRVFNFAVQWLLVPGLNDTQCGFKMFTAVAADAIFPHVTVAGWGFDVEVMYIARRRGLRIREVPIEWHYRRESRVRMLRDGVRMFGEIVRLRLKAWRGDYASALASGESAGDRIGR